MRTRSGNKTLPISPIMRLPAELIDLIVFHLAKEDVDSFSRVNSIFNAFANRRSWRVYKLAFSFRLSSLKAACHPIVSNPTRARSVRVLVIAPGFSLSKRLPSGKNNPTTIMLPTCETSRVSLESVTKLLAEALLLLPNLRELVFPEIRHHYPNNSLTSHQLQWLNHVYEVVGNWCKTSLPRLTGLYSFTPQTFMAPILESASGSLERIALLNQDQGPFSGTLAAFSESAEPLLHKVPNLTHFLYPSYSSQPLTAIMGIQNTGLVLISRPLLAHPKVVRPPKYVLLFFKEDSKSQRSVAEYWTQAAVGDVDCINVLGPVLEMVAIPFWFRSFPSHEPSEEDVNALPSILHLKYYFERASALIGQIHGGPAAFVTRTQLIKEIMLKLCELFGRNEEGLQLQQVIVSFWFSDTTVDVKKMVPRFQLCVDGVLHNVVRYQAVLNRKPSPSLESSSPSTPVDSWEWSGETEIEDCPPRWGLDGATWDRLCGFGNVTPPTLPFRTTLSTADERGTSAQ
ncbi:hypothetical protein DL93DRAFT_2087138 [Clavulina sp. PMI_390]|nr:hypothetical protein DL93DRAFT_2087138 [Clavulina sp. PMI_390]